VKSNFLKADKLHTWSLSAAAVSVPTLMVSWTVYHKQGDTKFIFLLRWFHTFLNSKTTFMFRSWYKIVQVILKAELKRLVSFRHTRYNSTYNLLQGNREEWKEIMITLQNKHSIIVQVLMQTSASDVQGRAKKN